MTAWLRTSQLCERLGCGRSTLHHYRTAGILRPGEHYRRVGTGITSPLQWHVEAVEAALLEATRQAEAPIQWPPITTTMNTHTHKSPRTYLGVEINDTWPAACYQHGAARDWSDPEHYEALIGDEPPYRRVAGRTLTEIRAEIRAALATATPLAT